MAGAVVNQMNEVNPQSTDTTTEIDIEEENCEY